jgi:hypothetical protein
MVTIGAGEVEPTPVRLLDHFARILGVDGDVAPASIGAAMTTRAIDVIVINEYERFAVVDAFVRNELLPALPWATTTVSSAATRRTTHLLSSSPPKPSPIAPNRPSAAVPHPRSWRNLSRSSSTSSTSTCAARSMPVHSCDGSPFPSSPRCLDWACVNLHA